MILWKVPRTPDIQRYTKKLAVYSSEQHKHQACLYKLIVREMEAARNRHFSGRGSSKASSALQSFSLGKQPDARYHEREISSTRACRVRTYPRYSHVNDVFPLSISAYQYHNFSKSQSPSHLYTTMAFRKRNVALSRNPGGPDAPNSPSAPIESPSSIPAPGVRPSPIDGRPTTSTGTPSLDGILAGHAGIPLGNSILIEESGTTDYAGALLRFYAAEGVVQGHKVHVVGMEEVWGRELPGISEERGEGKRREVAERMKIAWRYEGLGQFESSRGACYCTYFAKRMQLFSSENYLTMWM